jgi:phosphonate transport system permease protein
MLAGAEVSSMLIIFVLLVACADLISTYLRKRLG